MQMIQIIQHFNKWMIMIFKKVKKNGINTAQKRVQKKNQKMDHMKIQKNMKKMMKNYKILVKIIKTNNIVQNVILV